MSSRGQKRAIETAPLNPKEGSPADISTADGAKVIKNLENPKISEKKVGRYLDYDGGGVRMHKRKTPSHTNLNASEGSGVQYDGVVSGYKVKVLIHSTQGNDQKLLGITDKNLLDFQAESEIAEKEVKNVVVKTNEVTLPRNRTEALAAVSKMKKPFINDDQGKEIKVSNNAVRHTASEDHDRSDVQCIGVIDQIIKNAVKIGNAPVASDEIGHTHAVEIYYCPVNIDGKQFSSRLTVKQYENGGMVLEDYQLYDLSAKEKSGTSYTVRGQKDLAPVSVPEIGYKVKDLIWKSQEKDQKLLGITDNNLLDFQVGSGRADSFRVIMFVKLQK